jgi:hypothetical protein
VRPLAEGAEVAYGTVGGGVLDQRTDHARLEGEGLRLPDHHTHTARLGAGLHDGDRLRVAVLVDQIHRRARMLAHREGETHRFRGRGRLIQQRRVGDVQCGQVRHHRLVVEQRLEPSLRDLRLVRRVGGVPAGVFEDVPLDHRRGDATGVAGADE